MGKTFRISCSGFGGQGVMALGKLLVYAGMDEGKEVSYLPAYGPEMRGGTANCSVIVSEEEIASPLCTTPDVLIALNSPSFHKFAQRVKSGGIILVNGSLSDADAGRSDVRVYKIDAGDIAIEAGNVRSANMVMTGALCALTGCVKEESILACIKTQFAEKPKVCEVNERAFRMGIAVVSEK